MGFCESVIDWHAQCLQGHFSLPVPFRTRNIRSSKTTSASDSNSLCTKIHGRLERSFHGPPKTDPTLQLHRHILRYQLRIQLGTAHFYDIDLYLRIGADLRDIVRHTLNLRTFPSNYQTGPGCVQCDADTIPSPLDNYLGKGSKLQATTQILPHAKILMKFLTIIIAFSIPFGAPITIDNESESDGIYFLSHNVFWWGKCLSLFVLRPPIPLQRSVALRWLVRHQFSLQKSGVLR